ncbi:transposase domain-containing protein [Pseudomonas sp.]|uniref:transposase domain-containing protein n=1 Tax=Pseudomonas sp. TaxID=306 RepID=UPI001B1CFDCC|nr:transposase domain-containing protein [Pseudomonas sp.]MBO9552776.1 transposase domain-containing protein [Pseudomonas sp.]
MRQRSSYPKPFKAQVVQECLQPGATVSSVPIDNNQVENQIRPWALGRSNWLFAGSLRSGKRAAAIMGLIQSVRMNGHDPYAYLKDVLTRLPTQRASEIAALLPHRWRPA